MRRLPLLTAWAVLLAACGGAATVPVAPATTETPTTAPAAPVTTETPTTVVVTTPAEAPEPAGPPAPDFQLKLSDGGTFVLSDEQKPVYLVFWAEW